MDSWINFICLLYNLHDVLNSNHLEIKYNIIYFLFGFIVFVCSYPYRYHFVFFFFFTKITN
jgi:hypothetical protein